jgi:hypothetical protein
MLAFRRFGHLFFDSANRRLSQPSMTVGDRRAVGLMPACNACAPAARWVVAVNLGHAVRRRRNRPSQGVASEWSVSMGRMNGARMQRQSWRSRPTTLNPLLSFAWPDGGYTARLLCMAANIRPPAGQLNGRREYTCGVVPAIPLSKGISVI